MTAYKTKYHRDATVTIWDVYAQQWRRTGRPSDAVLASLSEPERARVVRHCRISAREITINDLDGDSWHTIECGDESEVRASICADHPIHSLIDEAIASPNGMSQGTYEIDGDEYTTRVSVR